VKYGPFEKQVKPIKKENPEEGRQRVLVLFVYYVNSTRIQESESLYLDRLAEIHSGSYVLKLGSLFIGFNEQLFSSFRSIDSFFFFKAHGNITQNNRHIILIHFHFRFLYL
jgi:hypothetical protein